MAVTIGKAEGRRAFQILHELRGTSMSWGKSTDGSGFQVKIWKPRCQVQFLAPLGSPSLRGVACSKPSFYCINFKFRFFLLVSLGFFSRSWCFMLVPFGGITASCATTSSPGMSPAFLGQGNPELPSWRLGVLEVLQVSMHCYGVVFPKQCQSTCKNVVDQWSQVLLGKEDGCSFLGHQLQTIKLFPMSVLNLQPGLRAKAHLQPLLKQVQSCARTAHSCAGWSQDGSKGMAWAWLLEASNIVSLR